MFVETWHATVTYSYIPYTLVLLHAKACVCRVLMSALASRLLAFFAFKKSEVQVALATACYYHFLKLVVPFLKVVVTPHHHHGHLLTK